MRRDRDIPLAGTKTAPDALAQNTHRERDTKKASGPEDGFHVWIFKGPTP